MEKHKNITAMKKLTVFALIIFIIFSLLNVFWFLAIYFPCYGYTYDMTRGLSAFGKGFNKQIGNFEYSVSVPLYMTYEPFLFIKENVENKENKNIMSPDGERVDYYEDEITLFIWPKLGGKYEFGAVIDTGKTSYMTLIDENGNNIPNETMPDEAKMESERLNAVNHDRIVEELTLAKNLWGFRGLADITYGMELFIQNLSVSAVVIILISFSAFVLIVLSFIWLFSTRLKYEVYVQEVFKYRKNRRITYSREVQTYLFSVNKPNFLKKNGFLLVQKGDSPVKLYIYPFNKDEKKYIISYNQNNVNQNIEINQFLKNKDITDQNREEAENMLKQAKEFWRL